LGAILGGGFVFVWTDVGRGTTALGDCLGIPVVERSVSLVEVFAGDSSLVKVPWRTRDGLFVVGELA
jgi:hypothetical protein